MNKSLELKATSLEIATSRAMKILDISDKNQLEIIEIKKPKSFLGLFSKEGLYQIKIKENLENIGEKSLVEKEKLIVEENEHESKIEKNDVEATIIYFAKNLLEKMGLNLEVEVKEMTSKYCMLNLYGEDNGIIIGKKGKSLNSYEYLLNIFIKDIKIEVDVEGFKEKRNNTLRELAKKMAEKAIKTGKIIKLNPMPPRERKIIHEIVNKYDNLDTYSEGKDPKRYIVIKKKR